MVGRQKTTCSYQVYTTTNPKMIIQNLCLPSGDATLSVMDVRSNKAEPIAQSEDQEDELLSIVPIKGYGSFLRYA